MKEMSNESGTSQFTWSSSDDSIAIWLSVLSAVFIQLEKIYYRMSVPALFIVLD